MVYLGRNALNAIKTEVLGCINKLADAVNTAVKELANVVDSVDKNMLSAEYDSQNEMIIFTKKG